MATGWESADLLARFNRYTGRPQTDAYPTADKYQILADAQQEVLTRIAGIDAKFLFGAPQSMSTADGGMTYTFGQDGNGYPLFPIGPASIYPSLAAIPSYPLTPGFDYLDEGIRIRGPNNLPINAGNGPLYWYGIGFPAQMSATVQPVLQPPPSRDVICLKAAERFFWSNGGTNQLMAGQFHAMYEEQMGFTMTMIRRHFRGGGAMGRLLYPFTGPAIIPAF